MLDVPGKPVIVCSAALLLSLIASASSLADPRSARPTPPGQDTSSGATNNTTPGSPQTSEPQASQASNGGNGSWTGGDGRLETSIPVNAPPPERRWLHGTAESRIGPPFGGLRSHESRHLALAESVI